MKMTSEEFRWIDDVVRTEEETAAESMPKVLSDLGKTLVTISEQQCSAWKNR